MRYHGGKWKLAPDIIRIMPAHKVYVELFGGSAAVMLRKQRMAAEVYNDIDGSIVNVFRVLQSVTATEELLRRLYFTPYARSEFDYAYAHPVDEIEWACKTIILSYFGFGTDAATRGCKTGFRANLSDLRALPSQHWAAWPDSLLAIASRMRGVLIENIDAINLVGRYDTEDTLFYADPPYVLSSRSSFMRSSGNGFRHEMKDEDHAALASELCSAKGMVIISGYHTDLYRELYAGWHSIQVDSLAYSAKPRTEVLWINPAAHARRPQLLFAQENHG